MVTITADALTVSIPTNAPDTLLTNLQAGLIELLSRAGHLADFHNYTDNGCIPAGCQLLQALQPTETQTAAYLSAGNS